MPDPSICTDKLWAEAKRLNVTPMALAAKIDRAKGGKSGGTGKGNKGRGKGKGSGVLAKARESGGAGKGTAKSVVATP